VEQKGMGYALPKYSLEKALHEVLSIPRLLSVQGNPVQGVAGRQGPTNL